MSQPINANSTRTASADPLTLVVLSDSLENRMASSHQISLSSLPSATQLEMHFLDSSDFQPFTSDKCLPTPGEVRSLSHGWYLSTEPRHVRFEDRGLIVKFGGDVAVEEALCLWALRKARCDVIVPEVYGWRVDGSEVFIYMELLPGVSLKERWPSLCEDDRAFVCSQLYKMMSSLRCLKQEPDHTFLGSINRGPLKDPIFAHHHMQSGPFSTVRNFNDWFSRLPQSHLPPFLRYIDSCRRLLPDNAAITFTHGNLRRANIIVDSTGSPRILGIIDWAQAGWYPDYWEYCKAAFASTYLGEWRSRWIPRILMPREEEWEAFGEYILAMSPFSNEK